jgi:ribosomal protein S18 acetylase RimI-like enzyme
MALDLAARAIDGFAETLARLGRTGVGGASELRERGLVGARVPWAADNHWIDAAVAQPGADLANAPHCVWSAAVPEGRVEVPEIAMPAMGLVLADLRAAEPTAVATPSLPVVGALNDRAYGQADGLGPLIAAIDDPSVRAHGLRVDGDWACVAMTLRLGDDVSVQYVATDPAFRRRGLASRLLSAVLRDAGAVTATLTASPDGRGVYERLGFRTVATLHASVAGGP